MIESLADGSIQMCIAFVFVWALCAAVPKLSPSAKCWLWRLVLLKALVSLIWIAAIPVLPRPNEPVTAITQQIEPSLPPTQTAFLPDPPAAQVASSIDSEGLILALCLAIALAALSRLAYQAIMARRLVRRAQPVTAAAPLDHLTRLGKLLRLRRLPQLSQDPGVHSPLVTGVLHPVIVLPQAALQDEKQIAPALAHELSHVKRLDLFWDLVVAVIRAVFWFHPLAWFAASRARVEAEIACDAAAMEATGQSPQAYGSMLVSVAMAQKVVPGLSLPLGSPNSLERRLTAMKKGIPNRKTLRKLALAVLLPSALVLMPMRFVEALPPTEPKPPAEPANQAKGFEFYRDSGYFLFGDPAVRNDLGLTEQQVNAIEATGKQSNAEIRALGEKLAQFAREKRSNKERLEYDSKERPAVFERAARRALDVLTPEQRTRLAQLALQYNGPAMLRDPALATKAGISESTRKAIAALYADYAKENRQRSAKASSQRLGRYFITIRTLTAAEIRKRDSLMKQYHTAEGAKRDAIWAQIVAIDRRSRKPKTLKGNYYEVGLSTDKALYDKEREKDRQQKNQLDARILKLLTPSQKAKWTEMQGKKITFTPPAAWAQYVWSNGRYVKSK